MQVLLLSVLTITLGLFIHLVWWKIKIPKSHKKAILILFIVLSLIVSLLCLGLKIFSFIESILFLIFIFGFVGSYLISYTLIETDGPTFLILMALDRVADRGLSSEEFKLFVTDDMFVFHRIEGLLESGLMVIDGENYIITDKGKKSLKIYNIPRRILGIKNLGG